MGFRQLAVIMLGFFTVFLAGCAVNTTGPTEAACAITEIEWTLTRKAELTDFQCKRSDDAATPALLFTADVQNTTGKPLRYRLSIVLPDLKKATGHLVPRKGVPPVVNPGETEKVTIVFENTAQWPEKAEVSLIVLPEQPEMPETPEE